VLIDNYRAAFGGARSLTYRLIDGADHALSDPTCRHAYTTILVSWITEMIAGKRAADVTSQKRLQEAMQTNKRAAAG
jgi:hypothetical protein